MKSNVVGALILLAVSAACGGDLVFENEAFRLVVGDDAVAKSLVVKATGEETLRPDRTVPLFSVTQTRPFNNEVKLAYPNKRTTYPANRLRREGDRLVVGFEIAPYEAVVEVKTAKGYIAFELKDFLVDYEDYGRQKQRKPPVDEFRVLQLPVKDRENYGCWLGVSWDDRAALLVDLRLEAGPDDRHRRPVVPADAKPAAVVLPVLHRQLQHAELVHRRLALLLAAVVLVVEQEVLQREGDVVLRRLHLHDRLVRRDLEADDEAVAFAAQTGRRVGRALVGIGELDLVVERTRLRDGEERHRAVGPQGLLTRRLDDKRLRHGVVADD